MAFDPLSLFLLHGWQQTAGWSRAETLRQLGKRRNANYAQRFGFVERDFPTEGGLHYFLTTLGQHSEQPDQTVRLEVTAGETVTVALQLLNELIAQLVTLIHQAGLLSPTTWDQALVCPDGMIHAAASRMRCAFVQDCASKAQGLNRLFSIHQKDPVRYERGKPAIHLGSENCG